MMTVFEKSNRDAECAVTSVRYDREMNVCEMVCAMSQGKVF
jgi:hypothetical protein